MVRSAEILLGWYVFRLRADDAAEGKKRKFTTSLEDKWNRKLVNSERRRKMDEETRKVSFSKLASFMSCSIGNLGILHFTCTIGTGPDQGKEENNPATEDGYGEEAEPYPVGERKG